MTDSSLDDSWNTYHDRVAECLDQTLKSLGTDYLDLYLVHWPVRLVANDTSPLFPLNPDGSRATDRSWNQQETWRQMEEVLASGEFLRRLVKGGARADSCRLIGKVKAIGVSNFSIPYLEHLSQTWKVVPAINQVELHPYNPQHDLHEYCKSKGILLEAYCPLGSTNSPLLGDEELLRIAKKNGVSPATILISYQVNRGIVVLPKSVTAQSTYRVLPSALGRQLTRNSRLQESRTT